MGYRVWLFILEYLGLVNIVVAYYRSTIQGYTFTSNSDAHIQLSQYDAGNWCRSNGTQLMEIQSNEAQNVVSQFMRDSYTNGLINGWMAHTNAKRDGKGWQWVNGAAIGGIVIEQQGPDLSTSFGYLQNSGSRFLIAATLPTDKRGYICEGNGYCSSGEMFNSRCYKSYTDSMDWFDARNQCLNGGGDLASFDFIIDSQGLSVLNRTWISSTSTYWIGIRRLFWKWQSYNAEIKYTKWLDSQPVYKPEFECICLNPYDWNWNPCDCSKIYQVVCLSVTATPSTYGESTIRTTTSTTTTTTTTTPRTTTKTTTTINVPLKASSTKSFSTSSSNTIVSNGVNTSSASGSTVFPSTTLPSAAHNHWSGSHPTYSQSLGIGLGVGIAGGLIISAIIVGLYNWARKRGWSGTFNVEKVPEYSTPDSPTSETPYALIRRKSSQRSNSSAVYPTPSSIIYAYSQPSNSQNTREVTLGSEDPSQKPHENGSTRNSFVSFKDDITSHV